MEVNRGFWRSFAFEEDAPSNLFGKQGSTAASAILLRRQQTREIAKTQFPCYTLQTSGCRGHPNVLSSLKQCCDARLPLQSSKPG
jgi:hypothetical protein